MDADDAGQTRAEIGAENWDQTPAKGWKIEKKLRQVGSVDKTRIMAPKDIPPEAIQKEDGCELCKAGVRNKAFVCFRMPGARACIRCVQNKLKCSFNIPEGEDDDGDDEDEDDGEDEDEDDNLGDDDSDYSDSEFGRGPGSEVGDEDLENQHSDTRLSGLCYVSNAPVYR